MACRSMSGMSCHARSTDASANTNCAAQIRRWGALVVATCFRWLHEAFVAEREYRVPRWPDLIPSRSLTRAICAALIRALDRLPPQKRACLTEADNVSACALHAKVFDLRLLH